MIEFESENYSLKKRKRIRKYSDTLNSFHYLLEIVILKVLKSTSLNLLNVLGGWPLKGPFTQFKD